ncbi:hypothetical protein QZH41_020044 [Actinostola sp. cb2023]|nr:hypothetical protein QZH41_020044 [Actinostola sp. cb2023]
MPLQLASIRHKIRVICNTAGVWKDWLADRVASRLLLVNFVLDPFIYLLVRKQYRRTLVKFCCWCFPCSKKHRKESIKVRFAYSASLKSGDIPTVTEQDAHPDKEHDNEHLVAMVTPVLDDKPPHLGTLRDKQGILPTITEDDVRDALRSLAQDPGFANEGMSDDVDSVEFNEIMETLKDCFSGQRSRSNTRKLTGESVGEPGSSDDDLLISIEGDTNVVFSDGVKTDPAVGVKALQVMDVIQTKRRAKQIEKMV